MPKQPTGKARKAKSKKKSKAKQPAWVRMTDHLAQVILRNSLLELAAVDPAERDLACRDLEDEIRSGRRKWRRRNLETGKCENLSAAHCEKRQIALVDYNGVWRAEVHERQGPRWGAWGLHTRDDEHVYFVSADRLAQSTPVRSRDAVGRPPSFKSKRIIAELQREQRSYEKDHPNALKKVVEQHLLNWAKDKGITASLNTIRKYMSAGENTKN